VYVEGHENVEFLAKSCEHYELIKIPARVILTHYPHMSDGQTNGRTNTPTTALTALA